MVPFPRLHFFMPGFAPLTARGSQQYRGKDWSVYVFGSWNQSYGYSAIWCVFWFKFSFNIRFSAIWSHNLLWSESATLEKLKKSYYLFSPDCPWADPADVRRQEHDGRLWPPTRTVPHCRRRLQGQNVHEGGKYLLFFTGGGMRSRINCLFSYKFLISL